MLAEGRYVFHVLSIEHLRLIVYIISHFLTIWQAYLLSYHIIDISITFLKASS